MAKSAWATTSRKDPRFNLCGTGTREDAERTVEEQAKRLGCGVPDDVCYSVGSQ